MQHYEDITTSDIYATLKTFTYISSIKTVIACMVSVDWFVVLSKYCKVRKKNHRELIAAQKQFYVFHERYVNKYDSN